MARPLTEWEVRTLEALAAVPHPGAEELRAQVRVTTVTAEEHYSDAVFISLGVETDRVSPASLREAVMADWELESGWSGYTLLFLKDGYLSHVELHMNVGTWPMVSLPAPDRLELKSP